MALKAKTYAVEFGGSSYLVMAITKAGACRDLLEHLAGKASADLATGEQLYEAGQAGVQILGQEKYKRQVDPNQLPLTGVPESAGEE